ncbi:hypothetical protein [Arthrobacter sp. MYb213]|uniref:hypothetical protein n=1 Tax=Arthrobacter sp. MYb213 TaxID=1848595 RepID=UPI000CFB38AB|nr:hypothetical protein [Arthrobacter sp. MYb213]PRB72377.1 hypothetical protein CQ011_01570 [Arthrobacter sp. MYb213]
MNPLSTLEEIRAWIISGTEHEIRFAVQGAAGYSIGKVNQILEELSFEHDENCESFLLGWLKELSPLERLAAAVATEHHYQLGLVAIERAADQEVLQVMESVKPALAELAQSFQEAHSRASDPDPSYTKRFTVRLLAYAEQLRSVAEDINNDVPLLQLMSDEVAKIEAASPEGYGHPAKYQVEAALALNPKFTDKKSLD